MRQRVGEMNLGQINCFVICDWPWNSLSMIETTSLSDEFFFSTHLERLRYHVCLFILLLFEEILNFDSVISTLRISYSWIQFQFCFVTRDKLPTHHSVPFLFCNFRYSSSDVSRAVGGKQVYFFLSDFLLNLVTFESGVRICCRLCTMVQNREKDRKNSQPIIYFPTSEWPSTYIWVLDY